MRITALTDADLVSEGRRLVTTRSSLTKLMGENGMSLLLDLTLAMAR